MAKYVNECGEPLPHYRNHVSVSVVGSSSIKRLRWFSTIWQAARYVDKRIKAGDKSEFSIDPDWHAIRAEAQRLSRSNPTKTARC